MSESPAVVIVSGAPTDPEEKKKWTDGWVRVQIAMWLPAKCVACGIEYASVDDFIQRGVKEGFGTFPCFVDSACWPEYERLNAPPGWERPSRPSEEP